MVKVRLHSTSDASSRPALLLRQIQAVFSVVAPCPRGASLVSVRRRTFTTDCYGIYDMARNEAWVSVGRDHKPVRDYGGYNDFVRNGINVSDISM